MKWPPSNVIEYNSRTAVYTLVSGSITHQKQQIAIKGDITQQYVDTWAM